MARTVPTFHPTEAYAKSSLGLVLSRSPSALISHNAGLPSLVHRSARSSGMMVGRLLIVAVAVAASIFRTQLPPSVRL